MGLGAFSSACRLPWGWWYRGSDWHLASGGAVNFPGDVAGLIAGKEDENRGDLGGLGGAAEDSLRAELFHLLLGHSGRDKWSPHRTWGYGVDANALLDGKAGKRTGEADDGCFGRGIGDEILTGIKGLDRPGVNNGSALFHLWEDRLAKAEHGEDIYAIRFLELIIGNVLEFFIGPLEGGIVHKDVDGAERIDGFPRHSLGYGMLANVAGEEDGFAPGFGNEPFGLASV
jgi:hypothetical protein